jgi:hypothetical protein
MAGQPGQDSQNRTAWTGQPGQVRLNRSVQTGQLTQVSLCGTSWTGQLKVKKGKMLPTSSIVIFLDIRRFQCVNVVFCQLNVSHVWKWGRGECLG